MPLWAIAVRSLAYRQVSRLTAFPKRRAQVQWRPSPLLPRSYSTALLQNQQDEGELAVPLLPDAELSLDSQSQGSVLDTPTIPVRRVLVQTQRSASGHLRRSQITQRRSPRLATAKQYRLRKPLTSTYWEREHSRIASFYIRKRPGSKTRGARKSVPSLRPSSFAKVEHILSRLDSGVTYLNYSDLSPSSRGDARKVWQQVALWCLAYEPRRMVDFLLATYNHDHLDTRLYESSLYLLSRSFYHTKDAESVRKLAGAFCRIVQGQPQRQFAFTNPFIRCLMKRCSEEDIYRILDTCLTHKVRLHGQTLLHFARFYAQRNHFAKALEMLLKASREGVAVNHWAFLSSCTTILKRSSVQPDSLRVCLDVVSQLVDIGVTFNLEICNTIMLNAIEAGDLKTAFDIYHSLVERGLQPDAATFMILLKACQTNTGDASLLNEVIRNAVAKVDVKKDPRLATAILHSLALYHAREQPTTAVHALAEAYAQFFDMTPLRKLDLPISTKLQSNAPDQQFMPPTRHALTFMIGATIQHYVATGRNTASNASDKQINELYIRWRAHVEDSAGSGDPALADLATTDHLANVFLSAFISKSSSLIHGARVVRDMQRPLDPARGIVQAKPSVQTWSIFLNGFTRHKQMELAERVLTYMRKEGVEPNAVTYYALVDGYARVKNDDRAIEALRESERNGVVWSNWTYGGLERGSISTRVRVAEELRRQKVARSLDFGSELRQGLADKLTVTPAVQDESEVDDFGVSYGEIAEHQVDGEASVRHTQDG